MLTHTKLISRPQLGSHNLPSLLYFHFGTKLLQDYPCHSEQVVTTCNQLGTVSNLLCCFNFMKLINFLPNISEARDVCMKGVYITSKYSTIHDSNFNFAGQTGLALSLCQYGTSTVLFACVV